MPYYAAYSLRLWSPRPLWHAAPVVTSLDTPPDITLNFVPAGEHAPTWVTSPGTVLRRLAGQDWCWTLAAAPADSAGVLCLRWRRQAFEMAVLFGPGAAQITLWWDAAQPDLEEHWQELSGWILGSLLGYAMCLRGLPTLHGSVVALGGQAVGLLGVSGAGKSTLAAAFVNAGYAMLADDHLVAIPAAGGYQALPGPPRLRLWPSSLAILDNADSPIVIWQDGDGKHHVEPASGAICAHPLPLAAVYTLMPRDPERRTVAIENLAPAVALNALMNLRFTTAPLFATYAADTLKALSGVAMHTPVRFLQRPHGLETLPAIVAAIAADVG